MLCCAALWKLLLNGWLLLHTEYCITEDYALSMELKAAGYKGAYMVGGAKWGGLGALM